MAQVERLKANAENFDTLMNAEFYAEYIKSVSAINHAVANARFYIEEVNAVTDTFKQMMVLTEKLAVETMQRYASHFASNADDLVWHQKKIYADDEEG